ncbi:MAG TPA: anti-sigma factor antagonist [Firmicutes bacterium]|uniref:Anti-sigma factor antagonist n=1 Tax=Capillibacterium thermochitinicola TaxID=2699427 RepID=A0A8J6I0W9_9FIRM|nr:anti-sigma factor antagonist [Capillibacterium thermochitinicola]HHW12377.1 anti-sigma factor antagonist [Bacillota bacterium]
MIRGDSSLKLELKRNGRVLTVQVSGELDLSTSPTFRNRIEEELGHNQEINHLILDLKETSFVDSSGLGAILGRYKSIAQRNGKLTAVNVPPHLQRLFELSGLLKVMTICSSLEEAQNIE